MKTFTGWGTQATVCVDVRGNIQESVPFLCSVGFRDSSRVSGLTASVLTHWAIPTAPPFIFCLLFYALISYQGFEDTNHMTTSSWYGVSSQTKPTSFCCCSHLKGSEKWLWLVGYSSDVHLWVNQSCLVGPVTITGETEWDLKAEGGRTVKINNPDTVTRLCQFRVIQEAKMLLEAAANRIVGSKGSW